MGSDRSGLYRMLPSVEKILSDPEVEGAVRSFPRPVATEAVRTVLDEVREEMRSGAGPAESDLSSPVVYRDRIVLKLRELLRPSLRPVVNATGVVIHTNLGRAPLSEDAFDRARPIATRYSNLEFDLEAGARGSRYAHAERLLRRLTGAEAALVANNNAAAVLVALHALAAGREVIVSRGELIEIGGSFRLPEIMQASGARLVEVGTTNRTRPDDYRKAIGPETALLMKVHLSNFRLEGFTADVPSAELARIGAEHRIPVLYDLGSGAFVRTDPRGEPTAREELESGPSVLTMSGDKLLGSVQAGILLGRKAEIERIKNSPMMRAVRVDKLTLALLEATLLAYLDPEKVLADVPVLRLISRPAHAIRQDADRLREAVLARLGERADAEIVEGESEAGGGAIGQPPIPTRLVAVRVERIAPDRLAARLRAFDPPVIVRVRNDRVVLDPRTLFPEEFEIVADALAAAASGARAAGGVEP
ncbi:MAG: L-seryl-tRNA(Sec) selenium transferase [Candidatus Latescibacterota bacterium]|nr:MAG: L-seryl-tRNA(Sec) selenium transferase [Candidatus Latescibacterota bacterium]